jgi:hypothetical protein
MKMTKIACTSAAALTFFLVGFSAFANDSVESKFGTIGKTVYVSELTRFNVDPGLLDQSTIHGGNVSIDAKMKFASLTLYRGMTCPKGMLCAQVMPMPVMITLPVVSVEKNAGCNTRVIIAEQDLRPVDGGLQRIVIRDNSKITCKTFIAVADTEVEYVTEGGRIENGTRSTFQGERFQRVDADRFEEVR